MVLFNAIGPVGEKLDPGTGKRRVDKNDPPGAPARKDQVVFSADALEAARSANKPERGGEGTLRLELIERAKERIRMGFYKQPTVIDEVAASITHSI